MNKRLLVSILTGTTWWACAASPVNVALHKPYKLTPVPRYRHCTDPGDKTQLTDGEYSKGYFWTQKGTVGWNQVAPVICTIDLGKVEPICGVSWSTAAGAAGVRWPECLLVLVSDDGKRWTFIGDLCDLGTVDKKPPADKYATFRFASDRMKGRGRYVSVVAAARPFCFVDEIEVWRGPDAWLEKPVEGPQSDDPRQFYMKSRMSAGVAARMKSDMATIVGQAEERGLAAALAERKARAEELRQAIDPIAAQVADTFRSVLPYGATHEAILALNAPVLRAAGVKQPLVRPANRWDPLDLTDLPETGSETAGLVTLDLMRGEVRGAAVNITNPFDESVTFTLWLEGMPAALNLELREVLVTDTQSRTPVTAALRLLAPDNKGRCAMIVPAGCTRQLWISCRRPTGAARTHSGKLAVMSGEDDFRTELPLCVRLRDLDFPQAPRLHVGGWDYVQGTGAYYKAPGNLKGNLALMRDMYVDSPWANSAVFPKGVKFDESGRLTGTLDFTVWDEWVKRWRGARNYCVFFSAGKSFHGEKMGTPRFTTMVGSWLTAWVRHLEGQGLEARQMVILLVDEPHERSQDETLIAWAKAVRAAGLGVTLFVDPTYADPTKGDPDMYALHDVLCPNTPMMLQHGKPFRDFYLKQQADGKTLWLYSCSGPAKLLDPVTYHRAQAWLAFQMGAEGSFYWAFGCGGGIGDSWRAYVQSGVEYSPYFVGPDSVMEGKHSEALREGVQDHETLCMLRDSAARARKEGLDAPWVRKAEALLTEGVARAVAVVTPKNMYWHVDKDRNEMDVVRGLALDLLEEAKRK
jgi:hypothetical protein